MKLVQLSRVLLKNPREFRDRVLTVAEFHADRMRRPAVMAPVNPDSLVRELSRRSGVEMAGFLQEEGLREIEQAVADAQGRVKALAFPLYHNARQGLARLCYAVCRQLQPEVVVETGVGYGVSSAFFLQALAVNGKGSLVSIDLPPLGEGADEQSGCLVPTHLRSRWRFLRGRARKLLPAVVAGVPAVDIFLHDSLHTYRNMRFEYQTVWPHLREGGVLLSDDVAMNRAFGDFCADRSPGFCAVDGEAFFGLALKTRQRP